MADVFDRLDASEAGRLSAPNPFAKQTDCNACRTNHHADCEFADDDGIGPDDDGVYTITCCCGAWSESRPTDDEVD